MGIKVAIPYPHMKEITDSKGQVEVEGGTIGQCLSHLVSQFPAIEPMLFDKEGKLLPYVVIFHNGQGTHTEPDPLAKTVIQGDELTITLLLAGG